MIFIFSFIVYGTGVAHGEQLVPKTLTELYLEYQGKLVITGQILSVSEIPQKNLTSYDVKIQNYITRPQQGSVITAVSPKNDSNPIFNVNDKVQLYLDKNSTGYVISPYSFKMLGSCSSFGPSYADFGPLSGDAAALVPFRFTDSQGNPVSPMVGQPNLLSHDVFNDSPLNKTTVDLNITLDGNPVPVFHDTKYLDLKPCTGTTLTWNFVPAQMGNYTATVKQTFGIYDNKINPRNYTVANYDFFPSQIPVDNSLLSPLEQFRSGTLTQDIKCAQGFELVARSEDGSPACVKYSSVQKLVDWGLVLTRLSISDLNETYGIGEQINATINFQGIMHYCDYPRIQVLDSNQNVVLKSKERNLMCVSIPFIPLPYATEKFDLQSEYGGPIEINNTGSYTIKISLYGNDIEKEFTVDSK